MGRIKSNSVITRPVPYPTLREKKDVTIINNIFSKFSEMIPKNKIIKTFRKLRNGFFNSMQNIYKSNIKIRISIDFFNSTFFIIRKTLL